MNHIVKMNRYFWGNFFLWMLTLPGTSYVFGNQTNSNKDISNNSNNFIHGITPETINITHNIGFHNTTNNTSEISNITLDAANDSFLSAVNVTTQKSNSTLLDGDNKDPFSNSSVFVSKLNSLSDKNNSIEHVKNESVHNNSLFIKSTNFLTSPYSKSSNFALQNSTITNTSTMENSNNTQYVEGELVTSPAEVTSTSMATTTLSNVDVRYMSTQTAMFHDNSFYNQGNTVGIRNETEIVSMTTTPDKLLNTTNIPDEDNSTISDVHGTGNVSIPSLTNSTQQTIDNQTSIFTSTPLMQNSTEEYFLSTNSYLENSKNPALVENSTSPNDLSVATNFPEDLTQSHVYLHPLRDGDDTYWPVAVAVTVGVPVIIVFIVTITVLHRKSTIEKAHSLAKYGFIPSRHEFDA